MANVPLYTDPAETRAFVQGWTHGINGKAREERHAYINAYSKGYWEGVADRVEEAALDTEFR